MSFHFLNGSTYGAYADNSPGAIIVDPLATIHATGIADALSLSSGPWTVTVNGTVQSDSGEAIYLQGPSAFVSDLSIGKGANISALSLFRSGVIATHATNITNAGHITAQLTGISETGDGDFRIDNLKGGVIQGSQYGITVQYLGTHTIVNAGAIEAQFAIQSQAGIEKVTNYGSLIGNVDLGDGNDVFTNFKKINKHVVKHGSVTGIIDLGAGDDAFNGGNKAETVKDGNGADTLNLGGGNDTWIGYLRGNGDLVDKINGGKGIDTYDASQCGVTGSAANFINLDSVEHGGLANTAIEYGGQPRDSLRNFENAIGSPGYDGITGTMGANKLWGGDGNDSLLGFGGNDLLSGDADRDNLIGGAGKDQLWGGADADTFVFESLKDSGRTAATRDTIHDFEVGVDNIFLGNLNESLGDIITGFLGVDVAFTGHKGDLRAVTRGDNTIVQLDVNGDKKVDFTVALDGHHALTVDDFTL